jgi:hypothetical protein
LRSCILDACAWRHPSQVNVSPEDRRWVLWLNANGVAYEELLAEAPRQFGVPLEADLLLVNYRGVGESTGCPRVAMDLVRDGAAAAAFLVRKYRASPKHILVHGHSMGGGAAPFVRARAGPGPITVDRSFSSLGAVAARHALGPMGSLVGAMLGAMAGCQWVLITLVHREIPMPPQAVVAAVCAAFVLAAARWTVSPPDFPGAPPALRRSAAARGLPATLFALAQGCLPTAVFAYLMLSSGAGPAWRDADLTVQGAVVRYLATIALCVVAGLSLAWSGLLSLGTPALMQFIGWDFPAARAFEDLGPECDRAVFWHRGDAIIPRAVSAAAPLLSEHGDDGGAVVIKRLTLHTSEVQIEAPEGQFAHMYPLGIERCWDAEIVPLLRTMLGRVTASSPRPRKKDD